MPDTTPTPPTPPTPSSTDAPLGVRCARCHRYLLGSSGVRRTVTGRWRHQSCARAPEPSLDEFAQLAGVLMSSHPWPRMVALDAELSELLGELEELRRRAAPRVASMPRQAGPPGLEQDELQREYDLLKRGEVLHQAIESERTWKARRLALEWADGH